jgi:uncharacterized protein YdaU (DUF1376 family)
MAESNHTTPPSPAFQFYPKDFLASSKVMRMTPAERGVYITLLCVCWLDGSLPNDVGQLARIAGLPKKSFARVWSPTLVACFSPRENGARLVNERMEQEREKQADYRKKQRANAESRWSGGNAVALPPHESGTASVAVPPHDSGNALHLLSSSSTPVSTSDRSARVQDARAPRPAPLISRRNLHAAYEGPRGLYVPNQLHAQLVAARNTPKAEAELFDWYERTCEAWAHGDRKADNPGSDMFKFWRARFDEQWPPASKRTGPAWHYETFDDDEVNADGQR